jgi:hypothetical protein
MICLEHGSDEPPHVLIAAEPVREQHRRSVAATTFANRMSLDDCHAGTLATPAIFAHVDELIAISLERYLPRILAKRE